jgi:predicted ATP-grasp superfamily ATP-dependent carboligase
MSRSSVLVLGVYHQTLAVMRSLHRAGFAVILGRGPGLCPERFSTACDETWVHPPFGDGGFSAALRTCLDTRADIGFVFPVGEESALAIAGIAWLRTSDVELVMVEPNLLRACIDKPTANMLAHDAGLTVPASAVVRSRQELCAAAQTTGFPLIVKGLSAVKPVFGRKAYLVHDAAQFECVFSRWPEGHEELLLQAYVEGPLEACDFVAQAGRVVGYFEAASVRTDMPDDTGFAVDFLSKPVTPDVLAACRQFCAATRYEGPGLLQFVRSNRDGKLYFIENNPRLSAGIAQAVLCGQDIPLLAMRVSAARRSRGSIRCFDERNAYRAGVRTHWLYRDLKGIINRRSELTRADLRDRLRAMVASCLQAENHMVWQWRDPVPSMMLYGDLFLRLAKALVQRAA